MFKIIKKILDFFIDLIIYVKFYKINIKNSKYYPYFEFISQIRSYLFYLFLALLLVWLYNVYSTSGMLSEKSRSAIELFSVSFFKKKDNKFEWVLYSDKLIKDDNYNRNYFTNVKFTTDPSSDSVQLIFANEAIYDANLKLINFTGNVHARRIYKDENITNEVNLKKEKNENKYEKLNVKPIEGFFDRKLESGYLEDNLYTDSLEYYYEREILSSKTKTKIVRPKVEIIGDKFEHRMKEKRANIIGNVRIKIYEE